MSETAFRQQLHAAVEEHPARLTASADAAIKRLLNHAAERLAAEPDRADEAQSNLRRFLDRAADAGGRDPGGADVLTVDRAAVDADAIQLALRDLCPIFPIC